MKTNLTQDPPDLSLGGGPLLQLCRKDIRTLVNIGDSYSSLRETFSVAECQTFPSKSFADDGKISSSTRRQ